MKKKIISALLCLVMALSLFTTAFASDALPTADPQKTAPQTGTLTIEKTIEGVTPAGDWTFAFTIKSTDAAVADQTVQVMVKKGETTGKAEIKNLPFGAYTVTEELSSAKVDGYALTAGAAQSIALTQANPSAIARFTNSYEKQYSLDVNVVKNVVKADTSEAPADAAFDFKAYCDNKEVGTLTLKTTAPGRYEGKLPIALTASQLKNSSAQLTIQEVNSGATGWKYDGAVYTLTVAVVNDQLQITDIRKSGSDASYGQGDKALEFTNSYYMHGRTPTPAPKPDDTKKPESPKTGDAGILLYAAAALTALGGGVMLVCKKRHTKR